MKQEPRPAYHRRQDLKRLQEVARGLPLWVADLGRRGYGVFRAIDDTEPLVAGRHEVIYAYLSGWRAARAQTAACDRCNDTDEHNTPFVTLCRACYDCWV